MPKHTDNPFSQEDLKQINKGMRALHDLIPLIERAERCGMDCDDLRAQMETQFAQLQTWKNEFFPGQASGALPT